MFPSISGSSNSADPWDQKCPILKLCSVALADLLQREHDGLQCSPSHHEVFVEIAQISCFKEGVAGLSTKMVTNATQLLGMQQNF